jgi:hypothetical protein
MNANTLAVLFGAIAAAAGADCHFPYNRLTEELAAVCFTNLGSENNFTVREYSNSGDGGAVVVSYNVSAATTTYQEAFELGAFVVIGYFTGLNAKNVSLLAARTTPLMLRPSRLKSNTPWFIQMAIAPGAVPSPPKPEYGAELSPLVPANGAPLQVAVRHERLTESPQPSDFEFCARSLERDLARSSNWRYDASAPASPTYAYFTGRDDYTGPFDIECWVGVQPV